MTFSDTKSKPQDPEFNFRIKCRSTVTSPINQKSKLIDNLKEIVKPDQRESIDYSIWQKKTIQEFETVKRQQEKELLMKNKTIELNNDLKENLNN